MERSSLRMKVLFLISFLGSWMSSILFCIRVFLMLLGCEFYVLSILFLALGVCILLLMGGCYNVKDGCNFSQIQCKV